jgi:hypothetical protein
MSSKVKKLALMLTIAVIFANLIPTSMKIVDADSAGGKIDLFTQKEPYSGKGPNMPGDAFGPQEIVILYALVTFNEMPVQNLMVAFNIQTPSNASFSLSANTNSSGIATVNFRIAMPSENISESEVFGEWHVLANVLINNEFCQDSLNFRVDWIVKLISVRTLDQNLVYQTDFGIGGDVGFEVTLRSIAMVMKSATIAVVVQDELGVPVNYSEMNDFKVESNEKLVLLYTELKIPKFAHVGRATVVVSALTTEPNASGVPYCPAVSAEFSILIEEPLVIAFHDVAVVEAKTSADSVEMGQTVDISAVIQNEGTQNENFNVGAYYDNVLIEALPITLLPYSHSVLNFTFDTATVALGEYRITVSIPYIPNEADLTDNVFVDGMIEIKQPAVFHDIAIVNVEISNSSIFIGDQLTVNVSIVNKGTETETFTVEARFDSGSIGTIEVNALASKTQVTLAFEWNTSSVSEGSYRISVFAPLPGDINALDNTFVDGLVQISAKPPPAKHYYLAVRTSPLSVVSILGEGWYYEGANVNLPAPEYVSVSTGVRYRFSFWDVDGTPKADNPTMVTMDANHTATAHYILQYFLTVRTDPPGIATTLGEGWYDDTSNVTLNASAVSDYDFAYWDVNGVSQGSGVNVTSVYMIAPQNATAHYAQIIRYTLIITSTAGGTTNPESGTYTYAANQAVQVTAAPNSNYVFDHWELDDVNVGSANPYTVMMNTNHTLKAVFSSTLAGWFVPEWFFWLMFLIVLIVIFLIGWLYRRRRKKVAADAFYTGWTAWFYCYDLRSRNRKF